MKINSTFMIFGLIIFGTVGAGITTAILAYKFASESLKAVQFPEENPAQKLALKNSSPQKSSQGFQILNEKDILVKVYDYVYSQKEASKNKKSETKDNKQSSSPKEEIMAENSQPKLEEKPFVPMMVKNQGVTMEIANVKPQQESLLLSVNLKNDGNENVKFLYSFLEIKDDQNRAIGGIADGLPTELPANGQSFSGEITIPLSLLNNSQKISLSLPNYPEQNVQLKIPAIPVAR
jgi:hypothetical protein